MCESELRACEFIKSITDSALWEGIFLEVHGELLNKPILIGNIYRPPRNLNENYETFTNDFCEILNHLNTMNKEVQ